MTNARWSTLVVALLLSAVSVTVLWSQMPPVYFTNDDVVYRLQIAGEDVPDGTATTNLFFTHAALAAAAVTIQQALPAFPLWDVILGATFIVGIAGLCAVVWSSFGPARTARLTALFVLLSIITPLLIGIQFTISAVICAAAAVVLAVNELGAEGPRRSILVAAGVLFLAGYFVRPMGAEAGALVTVGLLGITALAGRDRWTRVLNLCAVAGLMAGAFAILNATDSALYRARGQGAYYQYHWRVIELIEWGGANTELQARAVRTATGWSENDWDLLRRRWGIDAKLFGFDQIAKATEAAAQSGSESLLARTWTRVVLAASDAPSALLPQIAGVAILALAIAAWFGTVRGVVLTACLVLAFIAVCIGIHAAFKELPFHLLGPIKACFMAAVLVTLAGHRRPLPPWYTGAAAIAAFVLLALQAREAVQDWRAEDDQARSIDAQVREVIAAKPSLLVLHADAFPFESWWRPFREPPIRLPIVRLVWNNQDPRLQHFLIERRLPSLFADMCMDPSVFLVANPDRLDIVTRSLAEHDGLKVSWTPVFLGTIRVWRCEPSTG